MADNKAQIVVDGDVSPLRQKLREAARDLKQFGDEGRSSVERIGAPLGGLASKFAALGAVLSIGGITALAKGAIDAADGLNDLSQQLGISVPQLAGYKLAAESSGLTLELFGDGIKRLSVYMTQHADKLAQVGITSKNADGALAQLADRFAAMPDGAEKTAVAMAMMGRSGADMIPLLNGGGAALGEMIQRGRELYPVTQEMADAADQFNDRMAEMSTGTQGIVIQMGNKLLPILNNAIGLWRDNAKEIGNVNAALVGMGSLGTVGQTIAVLWANVSYVFKQVGNEIGGVAAQLAALFRGDFKGASIIGSAMKKDAQVARQEIDALEKRIMGIGNVRSLPRKTEKPSGGGSTGNAVDWSAITGSGGSAKTGKTDNAAAKSLADRIKAEEDAYKEAVKIAESYEDQWQQEYKAVAAAARKSGQERMQIDLLQADGARAAGLARIAELEAQSAHEVAMGGATQAEHLAKLAQFNDMRLAEESRFLAAKREIALQDPEQNPVELERIELEKEEIRRRYAAQGMEIQRQTALESQGIWRDLTDSISGLWDRGVQALMNGTLTWRNATQAIGAEMVKWFATSVVGGKVKAWLAGETVQTLATKVGTTARSLWEGLAAKKSVLLWAAAAAKNIMSSAWEAMAGAYKAIAGIPYVGPVLAPIAAGVAFAGVSKLAKNVMSAQKGYDVPKGLNPMTQLHEQEMVLPAQYANAIRNMTKGGAGEGGEGSAASPAIGNLNLSVIDKRGVRELFMDNPDVLAEAIRNAVRNGFR